MSIGRSSVRTQSGSPAAVGDSRRRLMVGVRCASGCRSVTATLISAEATGLAMRVRIEAAETVAADPSLPACYARLTSRDPQTPGEAGWLAAATAQLAAEATTQLLSRFPTQADEVLAAGVYEFGLWHVGRETRPACVSLFEPAVFAQQTGLPVIDAFAASDLAAGGQGGPVLAMPLWILLADRRGTRLLIDLGRTARLTFLPPRDLGPHGLLSFDVGPGMILPDTLSEQFSYGEHHYDPGGTMAVQGCCIGNLIDHWLADPYFQRPPPRWYPLGVRPDEELHKTVHMAVEEGWTVRDLLCTATHFIAESVARAVGSHMPSANAIGEVLLAGGGARNGFLLAEIARRIPGTAQRRATDDNASDGTLEAAAAAVLGLMFIDQVPGNPPAVTGAASSCVLGRLTSGGRLRWERLVSAMAENGSSSARLRNAV